MAYCPNCGTEVEDDTTFCPECGTNISEAAEEDEHDHEEATGWFGISGRTPGMKPGSKIRNSVLGFIYIIVIFAILGVAFGGGGDTDQANGGDPAAEPELITAPPEELLPTIDDFDADWRHGSVDLDNKTSFSNTQTGTTVYFRVTVHDSIDAAQQDYSDRQAAVREDGYGTESMSVGDEAFMYKPAEDIIYIHFREQNVVGTVEFWAGSVLTPKSNARNNAELLHEKITE